MNSNSSTHPQKVSWRQSLRWKFVQIFLLTGMMGTLLHFASYWFLESIFLDKLLQMAYWSKAEEYALRLEDVTSPIVKVDELHRRTHTFSKENPLFDIYLVDKSGTLVYSNYSNIPTFLNEPLKHRVPHSPESKVSLTPITEFLQVDGYPFLPIYGINPARHRKGVFPILAAELRIENEPGYVYVVVKGAFYLALRQMLGDFSLALASVIFILSVVTLTIILGIIFSHTLLRRFSEMTQTIVRFANGDYSTRIEYLPGDEIGIQAQTFNEMAATIEENIQQLEENDEMRRRLVANIYHDLRNPVAAMQQLLDALINQSSEINEDDKKIMTERALINCQDLSVLLQDLFELSKLDAKTERLQHQALDPKIMLRNVVKKLALEIQNQDLAIFVDIPKEVPHVIGDEKMINRVLTNLVVNAIRYSNPGGEICLSTKVEENDKLRIIVSDKGIGISETDREHIFQRFYRAPRAEDKERAGSGLGLAIAKQIVELHGQSISVESTLGEGSSFSFTLELSSPA